MFIWVYRYKIRPGKVAELLTLQKMRDACHKKWGECQIELFHSIENPENWVGI
jgi:hypothetical protein